MDQDNIEILTQALKDTFMDGVERIQDYDMDDFKEVIDLVAKNVSLSLYHEEDIDAIISDISIGAENICGQFGSSDSSDIDFFIVLPEKKPSAFMSAIREYYKVWFKGMIQARMLEYSGADIQFITVNSSGVVDWAEKGNETEINNSIYYTYRYHYLNMSHREGKFRDCPVQRPVKPEAGIKALKTVRSLLTFISRTKHRDVAKELLFRNDLTSRIEHIILLSEDRGLLSDIDGFKKPNHKDEDILKSITFSFLQLYAILGDLNVPYTKHSAIWGNKYHGDSQTPDYYSLAPLVLRSVDQSSFVNIKNCVECLDDLITMTLKTLLHKISKDDNGLLYIEGDEYSYYVRKELKNYQ